MKKIILSLFAAIVVSTGQYGFGADRFVVVNGQLLDATSLVDLEMAVGEPVPDGRYWLDAQSGAWGYENGPIQGYIGARYHGGPLVDEAYETQYRVLAGFGRRDLEREFDVVIDAALYDGFANQTYSQDDELDDDSLMVGAMRPSAVQARRRIAEDTVSAARAAACDRGARVREACIASTGRAAERATVRFADVSIGTVAAVCARLLELEEGCD